MARDFHPVRVTRPRPGRTAPPPRSTPGKGTGWGCPMALPALPVLLLVAAVRHLLAERRPVG